MRECLLDPIGQKAPYGVYPTDMLHIVKTQFDDMKELMTSNSWEMDDQGDNDAEEAR